jgi:biopolymer transport protein TolQ
MNAFHAIGLKGTADLATVAPGIAEALINTAAGLFVAIPSVIAYNLFVRRARALASDMEGFALDFLNLYQRQLLTLKPQETP